jgi:hypothetical protein
VAGRKSARSLKATLGAHPIHSIADARAWAVSLNVSVEQGGDSADAARAERAAYTKVADAHALYITSVKSCRRRTLKPRSIRGKGQIWSCDMERQIGERILQELTEDAALGVRFFREAAALPLAGPPDAESVYAAMYWRRLRLRQDQQVLEW